MSLINDALKRAKEAQRKKTSLGAPPLHPVEVRRKKWDLSLMLPALIILLIIAAFFFIGLAMAKHTVKKIIAAPEISATQQVETVAVPAQNPTVPPEVIGPATIIAPVPKPTWIQGIAYDPVHPWAIISGKTVYVGDSVDGMRVLEIARNSITLAGDGQTNTFVIGQK